MKKLIVLFSVFTSMIVLTENSQSQATTDDYRSKATGLWSAITSWERYDGSGWVAATSAPTSSTANVITIQSPHIITVNANVTVDQVVVNSGGTLSVSNGAVLTIANGAGTDMSVSGTMTLAATSGGTITTTGTLSFGSGSYYKHFYDGGAIPTATWNASSTCEITGAKSSTLSTSSTVQVFGNFTWNVSSQTGSQSVMFEHIQGNLNVSAGSIDLWYSTAGKSLTIDGNLNISGGNLDLGIFLNYPAAAVNLNGDFNMYSGTLDRTYTTGTVAFNFSKSGTQSYNDQSGGGITGTYINWAIGAGSTVVMSSSSADWTVSTSRTLTLNGTLDCNSHIRYIVGGGSFSSAASSTLVIRSQDGISLSGATGQIQVTGSRSFSASANYSFLGSVSSFYGGNALVSANDITVNPSSQTTLTLETNLTVNGNIYLTNGSIDIGNYDITLGSSATLNESATNVVTTGASGKLVTTRSISNVTSANIGGLGFIITTAANMGSTIIERHHTAAGSNAIKRYYKVTPTNNSGLNATVVFSYNQYELNSIPQNSLYIYKSSNFTTWSQVTPFTRQNSAYTLTATGVSSMSYWTAGDNTLPVELTSFNAAVLGSSVCLHWRTATEINNFGFDVERKFAGDGAWTKVGFVAGNGTTNAPQEYTFTDPKLVTGKYAYRLKQTDRNGNWKYSLNVEVEIAAPKTLTLAQNYPNPSNPSTTISYALPFRSHVMLSVFNTLGQKIAELVNSNKEAGVYDVRFDATGLVSGVYLYRLQADGFVQTKKLVVLK